MSKKNSVAKHATSSALDAQSHGEIALLLGSTRKNPALRKAIHAVLAASALSMTATQQAKADCNDSGTTTLSCSGDVSGGIFSEDAHLGLFVTNLSTQIKPTNGTRAINFFRNDEPGKPLFFFYDGSQPMWTKQANTIHILNFVEPFFGPGRAGDITAIVNGGALITEGGDRYDSLYVESYGQETKYKGPFTDGGNVTVFNNAQITNLSFNGRGIYAHSWATYSGLGGFVHVTSNAPRIDTVGSGGHGIFALSEGGYGANGSSGFSGDSGTVGGDGGQVTVDGQGIIRTDGINAHGILAISRGGIGGAGGDGWVASAGNGVFGGTAGAITVNGTWTITTTQDYSSGIHAESLGGEGGEGGTGYTFGSGGSGGGSGNGGAVTVISHGAIETYGFQSYGIFAHSVGGFAGGGGNSYGIVGYGGSGESAGYGSNVTVYNFGEIKTFNAEADAIYAQSVGGGGGSGGNAGGLSALGGSGAAGGNGGAVLVNNQANLNASGFDARGIFAQSVGGGGGDGGDSVGVAAIGGAGSGTSDGSTVTVHNTGSIFSGAHAIFAESIGGGGGNGGSSKGWFSVGGGGGAGGKSDEVFVESHGSLTTRYTNSSAIFAQSVGGGGGNGGSSTSVGLGTSLAIGGNAEKGGDGAKVTVISDGGSILTGWNFAGGETGDRSNGIFAQSVGGSGGNGGNAFSGSVSPGASLAVAMGGSGAGGGDGKMVTVTNGSSIETHGNDANGIFAESVGGGGGNGGFAIGISVGALSGSFALGGSGAGGGKGDVVQVSNSGANISTAGDRSSGLLAQSVGGGGGNGGFAVAGTFNLAPTVGASFAVGGNGGKGGGADHVIVESHGNISTGGDEAHGIFAQSVGGGGGKGGFSVAAGLSFGAAANAAFGGVGGGGGVGGVVDVGKNSYTTGTIQTLGDGSSGVFAQSVGGGGGNGGFAVGASISGGPSANLSVGGDGGTARDSSAVTVHTANDIITKGRDSHGVVAQSIGGGGGAGGFSVAGGISASGAVNAGIGGKGGGGGNAGIVTLSNKGSLIDTSGAHAYGIFAQSVGGGGGDGGFAVAGSVTQGPSANFAMGGSGAEGGIGRDVRVDNTSAITTHGNEAHALFAQSVGGGGGNGGFAIAGSMSATGGSLGLAIGGDGAGGGPSGLVQVINGNGGIATSGNSASGIFAQSVGGGGGNGGFAIGGSITSGPSASLSLGGNGSTGSNSSIVAVKSDSAIATHGNDSHGIFAQSVGGGGGNGGFAVSGSVSASGNVNAAIGGKGDGGGNADTVIVQSAGTTISTQGTHSYGVAAQSLGGGGGNGGFAVAGGISAGATANLGIGGSGAGGGIGKEVQLTSSSSVATLGNDSHALFAQSVGGGGGAGGFSVAGGISNANAGATLGGTGGGGGGSGQVKLTSNGSLLSTQGNHSTGALAQSVGGGGGDGGFAVTGGISNSGSASLAMGGTGDGGGKADFVTLKSQSSVVTHGDDSHGLFAQSVGGGGGSGGFAVAGNISLSGAASAGIGGSGKGGGSGDGVLLTSSGAAIATFGARSYGIGAQSIGGGGGDGGFAVVGSVAQGPSANFAVGGSGDHAGNSRDVTVVSTSAITTLGDESHGLFAQSIGGGGGSGGFAVSGSMSASGGSLGASLGGSGAGGGVGGTVHVDTTGVSSGSIITSGNRASGILAQSVGGGGGTGGFAIAGNITNGPSASLSIGGDGGAGSDSDIVTVESGSSVATHGNDAHGIFAQSVGGGGGSGGFAVAGSVSATGNANAALGGTGDGGGDAQDVTLKSYGAAISTVGTHSYGLAAQSLGGGGGDGGFSIAGGISNGLSANLSLGGSGAGGGLGRNVLLESKTNVSTLGDDSHGVFAQSVGGGGGSGGFAVVGGISKANAGASLGGTGDGGGDAGLVTLANTASSINTSGNHAYGVIAQSIGGGGGDGGFSVAGGIASEGNATFAMGGSGAGGGAGKSVSLTSSSNVTTHGDDSHGVFAQSVGGGGGSGGFAVAGAIANKGAATASLGGSGAGGGDADAVSLANTGHAVNTFGDRSYGVVAQSVGGGGGDGGFSVAGSITKGPAASFSMGGSGAKGGVSGDVTLNSTSDVVTRGDAAHAIFAQSIGGGGGSGGFSVDGSISADSGTVGASIGGGGDAGGKAGKVLLGTTSAIHGQIATLGDRAYGILAQSVGGGGGDGGFSVAGGISKGDGAKFSMGGSGGKGSDSDLVSVTSAATIQTLGDESHGIFAQSIGGGGGSGGFSVAGSISTGGSSINASIGGSGEGGGNSKAVTIASTGKSIDTEGDRSYGIVAQSIGGGGGDGGFSVAGSIDKQKAVNFTLGGNGDVGGKADAVNVFSSTNITTRGDESHAIFAQSLGGGGGSGGFSVAGSLFASTTNAPSIEASVGGSGKGGGDAGAVSVGAQNMFATGTIATLGDGSHGIFAQSLGGGGGNGGFSVAGGVSKSPSMKFTLGGSAGTGSNAGIVNVYTAASIVTEGNESHGVFAQSLGGGGGNGGFSIAGSANQDTTSLNASIGGEGGGGGKGGDVGVTSKGSVTTLGNSSYGVFAQSIGGGGGNGGFSVAGSLTSPPSGTATKKPANNIEFSMGGNGGNGDRGGNVNVANLGLIDTSGGSAHGILAQSIGGGGGSGGLSGAGTLSFEGKKSSATRATLSASVGGDGGEGNIGGDVMVSNTESIIARGSDARGIYAYSVGGGGGNGGASYAIDAALGKVEDSNGMNFELAVGGHGGKGNIAGAINVNSSGSIVTLGDRGDAVFAQSVGGGGGDGGTSQAASFDFTKSSKPKAKQGEDNAWNFTTSIGGNGGSANDGGHIDVMNGGNIETFGILARGIVAQSIGGGGGAGAKAIQGTGITSIDTASEFLDLRDKNVIDLRSWTITVGGSGGASGDGKDVIVKNSGSIVTHGLDSYGIFAQSIGGGGGEAQNFAKGTGAGGTAASGINSKFALGGGGGASGNGAQVTVTNLNSIETFGHESHGIFAQSIGGGGGVAGNVDRGFSSAIGPIPKLNIGLGLAVGQDGGSGGDGGAVTITNNGSITTHGIAAYGILAQSIGGGGGAAGGLGNDGTLSKPILGLQNFYGSAGGAGNAGVVTVNQTGSISVTGANGIGIFAQSTTAQGVSKAVNVTTSGDINAVGVGSFGILAQSLGKLSANALDSSDNIAITVNGGTIRGGAGLPPPGAVSQALSDNERGAAINFRDGKNNTLVNRGTVGDLNDLSRMAVLGEVGNETINNFGTFAGNLKLGGGTNALVNQAQGMIVSGSSLEIGSGVLTNNGAWSVGGPNVVATSGVSGNVVQSTSGRLLIDLDVAKTTADRINVTQGSATLGGTVVLNRMNVETLKPGTQFFVLVNAPNGLDATALTLSAPKTAVTTYSLGTTGASASPTNVVLTMTTDFAAASTAAGLTANEKQMGEYFNSIATVGTPSQLAPVILKVTEQADASQLAKLYDTLLSDSHLAMQSLQFVDSLRFNESLLSCRQSDGEYRFSSEGECGWMNLAPRWQKQDATATQMGVTENTMTLAAGFQRALSDIWHVGLGVSYDSADLQMRRANSTAPIERSTGDGGSLGAVIKANSEGHGLSFSLSTSRMSYDTTRTAYFATATSSQIARVFAGHLRYGYSIEQERWYVKPNVDLGYSEVRRGAFDEAGAGATSLHVASQTNHIVSLQPALEVGGEFTLSDTVRMRLFSRGAITRVLHGGELALTATFAGAPASADPLTVSQSLDRRARELSAGLDLFGGNGANLRVSISDTSSATAHARSTNVKVAWPF